MIVCLSVQVKITTLLFPCQEDKNKSYHFFNRIDSPPELLLPSGHCQVLYPANHFQSLRSTAGRGNR